VRALDHTLLLEGVKVAPYRRGRHADDLGERFEIGRPAVAQQVEQALLSFEDQQNQLP
jgi:hypothetical protein